jgi:hypothetical protein
VAAAREAYEEIGGFTPLLPHSTDWEMWVRLASTFPVGFLDEPWVLYRTHAESDTTRLMREVRDIPDSLLAIEMLTARLDPIRRKDIRRRAERYLAQHTAYCRRTLHDAHEHTAALRHAVWGFRLHPSAHNLMRLIRSAVRAAISPAPASPPADRGRVAETSPR